MSGFSLDLPTTKESSGGFSLDLPDTEAIKKEVAAELAPTPEEKTVITNVVKDKADQIMAVDLDSLAQRREFVQVIETFGSDLVRQSQTKNSICRNGWGILAAPEENPAKLHGDSKTCPSRCVI